MKVQFIIANKLVFFNIFSALEIDSFVYCYLLLMLRQVKLKRILPKRFRNYYHAPASS